MCFYRTFLVLLISGGISTLVTAQTQISGKVFGTDKLPLTGVSVLFSRAVDSTLITSAMTDTAGYFSVKWEKPENYVISFSLVGYKKHFITRNKDRQTNEDTLVVVLTEESHLLNAVTITSKRAPYLIEGDKTTVNLSSAITGSDGTMLDALKKIPGVFIQNNGSLILNGQAGASVMIDDKLTYLTGENLVHYLRSMPVSSVDKIELITHPSSRYDAAGSSGFINIRRKKKLTEGVNGTFTSNLEKGKKLRANESATISFHHNRMSFYADYSFYKGRDFIDIISLRDYTSEDKNSPDLRLGMAALRQQHYRSHTVKSGLNYEFSPKLNAGIFLYSSTLKRAKSEMVESDFYRLNAAKDSSLHTSNTQNFQNNNVSGGVDIDYQQNARMKWDASVNVQFFKQRDELDQTSKFYIPGIVPQTDTLRGLTTGHINIHNAQTNLSYTISDKLKLNTGIRYAAVNINSDVLYHMREAEQWQIEKQLTSSFLYKENIMAGYFQLNKKWNNSLSTDVGLRLEHTGVQGNYTSDNRDSVMHRSYLNLFPTFQFKYQISDKHQFFFLYGRRIIRPNYRDLNPYVEVNDRYLHEKGNTKLNPELADNFESSWIINQKYSFSIFYLNRRAPITKSYIKEDSDQITTTVLPLNLSDSYSAGLRVSINNIKPFSFWTLHFNSSLTFKEFQWQEFGTFYSNSFFTATSQLNNQFTLPQNWTVEATGFYNGKTVEGQAIIGASGVMAFGVRKNLFSNKLSVYAHVNDILLSNRPSIQIRNSVLQGYYKERRDTRTVSITLTYRFSSGDRTKEIKRTDNSEEVKRVNLP